MNEAEFNNVLVELFGEKDWPKPLHQLLGLRLVESGASPIDAAAAVGTVPARISRLVNHPHPLLEVLGLEPGDPDDGTKARAGRKLAELIVGRAAEIAFEDIYKTEMHTDELELKDTRESRSDTDYRVYNGSGRPIYRLNIKFHGAVFRRAAELVGIDPEDCFALATYKIYSSMQKQNNEVLPYLFAIVGVKGMTREAVAPHIPERLVEFLATIYSSGKAIRKRDYEDRLVEHMVGNGLPVFRQILADLESSEWQVLSARRADMLVREKLYERVFALSVPRFTQNFRGAEVDMHFSISEDMMPLRDFLHTLQRDGHPKVATMIERGLV